MPAQNLPEPWLRGTLTDIPAVQRAILHALELAKEDLERWCGELTDEQLNARPNGIAPVAFQLRHIARSLDRLLTYAEGKSLSAEQIAAMKAEMEPGARRGEVFSELLAALKSADKRVRAFSVADFELPRTIGRQQMPTTLGGILVHVADHTQRHVGQAITTAKSVKSRLPALDGNLLSGAVAAHCKLFSLTFYDPGARPDEPFLAGALE